MQCFAFSKGASIRNGTKNETLHLQHDHLRGSTEAQGIGTGMLFLRSFQIFCLAYRAPSYSD